MFKLSLLIFLVLSVLGSAFSQSPGCANIIAPPDFTLPCAAPCTTLTAVPFHVGATTTYTVASIPHAPVIPYGSAGGTVVSAGTDDVYSPLITLPFPFCFYGNTYTQCKVGSNGNIQFGFAGGGFCLWSFTANCPNAALPLNSIFGAFHDIDPSVCGQIKWFLTGTAPCRMLVVNFNNICHFSCTSLHSTHQIVLYETTNVIEVHVLQKQTCAGWNGGRAIIGIQNLTGAVGLAAPGRNSTPTWTVGGAGEAWRFTPNGAPIYTVSWFEGPTLLATGTNSVTVCPTVTTTYTASVTYTRCDGLIITDSDPITITIANLPAPTVTPVAETCAGYNNGSVTINNAAGPGPFTVTIAGPASATVVEPNTAAGVANFTGLPDGVYTYTVTSAAGCTFAGTFTINPGVLCCSVTAAGVNVLCNGGSTGTATATPTGLAGFTYSWSPSGGTGVSATGLAAGAYTVTMTDASGCVATAPVTITQPTVITGTLTPVNPLCNGGSTGSITVTGAAGGTGALQYSLNGGPFQVSNVFTGLAAGAYTVVIRDANNCTITLTINLTNPPLLTSALVSTTPATCGALNGAITVSGAGGTGALSYDLNPGPVNGTGVFTGLASGTYSVIITDANGCTSTVAGIVVGSSAGPAASILSQTNVSCFGGVNGSVLIGAAGGTAPITYTIDLAGPTGPVGPQASNSFINLLAGTYAVTVTDANGCTGTTSFTITSPTQVTYTTTFTPASCNGVCDGTITVTPAGGTPGYQFSSNNGLTFGVANPMTGLCAGNTFVVVQDANGCLANSLVVMTQPAAITATFTPTNPICQGICNGQVAVTATAGGAGGYTYSINGGAFAAAPTTFTGLCSGANTVVIQDANGCQLTNVQNLVDPPGYTITVIDTQESHCGFNDGALEVLASGGAAPYSYNNITVGAIQPTGLFTNLVAGGYDIEVTDANGCIEQLFVGVNDVQMDGILDGFTPATCFGSCDGTVQTHAINGAAPIQYELDLSGTFGLTGNFTGLCAGSHIVTIVDNGFCIFTIPFTIVEPAAVTFNTAVVDVACSGGATGSITFNTVAGGDGTYQYSITGGAPYQASPIFTGLAAGSYTLSVIDGNGCLGSGSATIIQAAPLSYVANITDLTCFGNSSGFLQIVASGGTGAYTYSIGGGPFTPTFTFIGLAAGTYNVIIQDAAGCQLTATETINEPALLNAGYTLTPTTCNGVCDGVIDVLAVGGTPTYTYSSDNGVTYQVSTSLTGLCAGAFQVVVKDINGCLVGSIQNITQPTLVTFGTTVTNSTCGTSNGTVTFTGTAGGTPGYLFSIDNGTTLVAGTNFTGLAAGTYQLVVEDANLCQVTGTATFINEASPVINTAFVTDVTCNAACNGSLASSATGGTGGNTFDIGGAGQASGNFAALCAGAYTLTVTDGNGCTDSQAFTVTEPAVLTIAPSGINLLCFNDNSGQISIVAGGGVLPYLYSYDGGATFSTLTTEVNLAANNYNLIVQDANLCQATSTQLLTEPSVLAITSQPQTNISCFGVCDGVATVNITGGTVAGLYSYNWAGGVAGPSQNSATGLCAGGYPVTITDDNGCIINANFVLTQPPQLIISSFSATDATCFGTCDGTISILAINAVLYSIDNGATFQAGANFTGICAGTYNIVVQDAAGCQTTTTATVNEPSQLVQSAITDITICYGGFGTLNANAAGGTPPYTYTWNTGAISQFYSITDTLPNTYTCTVTDLNGCVSAPQSANVSILPKFNASVVSLTDTICPGGTGFFSASGVLGVPAYTYWWYDAAGNPLDTITGASTFTTAVLNTPQNFTLVAFDQCPTYDTINLSVLFYPLPTPTFISTLPADGCSPLTVTFVSTTPASMTNGTCTWDFGDGNTGTGCIFATNTYYNAGQYSVTLTTTSPEGCTGDSTYVNFVTVYPDPIPDFTYLPVDPTILLPDVDFTNLTIGGSTYLWDIAGLDTSILVHPSYSFAGLEGGEYMICLTATSANGCVADTCKPLTLYDELLIYVPNSFTPDGDGTNDVFLPSAKGVLDEGYSFLVFNRWGEVIFQTDNKLTGWDGTHKSMKSKEDVYVWKLKAKNNRNGDVKEYVGHVTLLR